MNTKIALHHFILTLAVLAVMFLPMGQGDFFGSEGDWYSQHVGAAQALRQTIIDSGNPFPQFINIGGGINAFDLAYYGMFRPDVMISCLFPDVEIKYFIAGYAVLGVVASVNMMYLWLRKKGLRLSSCLAGGVLMAGASCFFHAHHQIMFVNYMPFLILALMGIDRLIRTGKPAFSAAAVFLIMIHSFYYGPVCLVVCLIYFFHQLSAEGHKDRAVMVRKAFGAVFLGIGASAVLLLPAAAAIFSTAKDSGSFSAQPMGIADLSMESLLYDPYGCGLTVICMFALLRALFTKEKRVTAAVILSMIVIPAIWFVLSGFLYPRAKILMPLITLIIWICAEELEDLTNPGSKKDILVLALCLIPAIFSKWKVLIAADWLILLAWMIASRIRKIPPAAKKAVFAVMMTFPLWVSIGVSFAGEDYIKADDSRQGKFEFTQEQLKEISGGLYRFDYISDSLANCNYLPSGSVKKTAMYSSVTNDIYSEFFYDIMDNPIRYRNRVILVPDGNIYFNFLMGIRYIVAGEDDLPYGYSVAGRQDDLVLAENKDVLPVCYGIYGSVDSLSAKGLQSMAEGQEAAGLLQEAFPAQINSPETQTVSIPLTQTVRNKAIILSFSVKSNDGQQVVIDINGTRNKLSDKSAPYPNGNNVFTYVLSSNDGIDKLDCVFSAGDYEITGLSVMTADPPSVSDMDIEYAKLSKDFSFDGKTIFEGSIKMDSDGYFVTSFPYDEGYEILADGREVRAGSTGLGFACFPLKAGEHMIKISYTAPGFRAGAILSTISLGAAAFGAVKGTLGKRGRKK